MVAARTPPLAAPELAAADDEADAAQDIEALQPGVADDTSTEAS